MSEAVRAELAVVVRQHAGRLAASLVQLTGDFATAEDLVQDAVLAALRHWAVRRDSRAARLLAVHRRPAPRTGRAAARSELSRQTGATRLAGPARSPMTGCD